MPIEFKKATKEQAKLRAAVFGPSGSGKTFTCLRIATGMGGSIAFIDTERGSAAKYSDRFDFDVLELSDRSIEGYLAAIRAAGKAGYAVLIVDSLSHAWQELLSEVDKLATAKYKGNTWSAWSEGTPKQRKLVDAILDYPGHLLATMRSRTEWSNENDGGRNRPVRVGLAPEQGKSIEYEFDFLLELSTEHVGNVIKDRTGKFQDRLIERPGEEFGQEMAAWLLDGAAPSPRPATPPATVVEPPVTAATKADPWASAEPWQLSIRTQLAEWEIKFGQLECIKNTKAPSAKLALDVLLHDANDDEQYVCTRVFNEARALMVDAGATKEDVA